MKSQRKSYWQSVSLSSDHARQALLSWFHPLSGGLVPVKAEVLCEIETDKEKKLRALMKDADGKMFRLERSLGGKRTSISRTLA